MGLSADQLRTALDALSQREPAIAAAIVRAGYPEPRIRARGYATLLRTIVGQQVSTKAAESVWRKLEGIVGSLDDPAISPGRATSSCARRGCHAKRQAMRGALPRR